MLNHMDIWLGLIMGIYCLGIVCYVPLQGNIGVYWVFMFGWLGANSETAFSAIDLLFLFVAFPAVACVLIVMIGSSLLGDK